MYTRPWGLRPRRLIFSSRRDRDLPTHCRGQDKTMMFKNTSRGQEVKTDTTMLANSDKILHINQMYQSFLHCLTHSISVCINVTTRQNELAINQSLILLFSQSVWYDGTVVISTSMRGISTGWGCFVHMYTCSVCLPSLLSRLQLAQSNASLPSSYLAFIWTLVYPGWPTSIPLYPKPAKDCTSWNNWREQASHHTNYSIFTQP